MAQNTVLGPTAKVDINGVPFRVISGRLMDAGDVNETTDSETSSYADKKEHHAGGFQVLQVDLELQLDTETSNPTVKMFVSPVFLRPSAMVHIKIWPEGRGVSNSNWDMAVVVRQASPGFMVRGSQPQGGTVSGVTTSKYKRPYESALLAPNLTHLGLV